MSSLFNHIFIPLVILLLFSKRFELDFRKVIGLSFIAVLPDADVLFLPHRAVFHNAFLLVIPILFFILIKSKRDVFAIIFFYLASHVVLDLFNGGIFLLYPLYSKAFFTHAELLFRLDSFRFVLNYGINDSIVNTGKGEPVISSENIGVSALLILLTMIVALKDLMKKNS